MVFGDCLAGISVNEAVVEGGLRQRWPKEYDKCKNNKQLTWMFIETKSASKYLLNHTPTYSKTRFDSAVTLATWLFQVRSYFREH